MLKYKKVDSKLSLYVGFVGLNLLMLNEIHQHHQDFVSETWCITAQILNEESVAWLQPANHFFATMKRELPKARRLHFGVEVLVCIGSNPFVKMVYKFYLKVDPNLGGDTLFCPQYFGLLLFHIDDLEADTWTISEDNCIFVIQIHCFKAPSPHTSGGNYFRNDRPLVFSVPLVATTQDAQSITEQQWSATNQGFQWWTQLLFNFILSTHVCIDSWVGVHCEIWWGNHTYSSMLGFRVRITFPRSKTYLICKAFEEHSEKSVNTNDYIGAGKCSLGTWFWCTKTNPGGAVLLTCT